MSNNLPVRLGVRSVSWYDYGYNAFHARNRMSYPSPFSPGIHPHYKQGWNKAALHHAKFMLSCEREAERQGRYEFLPKYEHLRSAKAA